MKKYLVLMLVFAGLSLVFHPVEAIEVKINDTRGLGNFYVDALKMILAKSGQECQLIIDERDLLSQARKVEEVRKGTIDLLYAGTSQELESTLLPIRFPIMRGLSGRRVFIIHEDNQHQFDMVKSVDDLRQYEAIQGLGWADIQILEAAGLKTHSAKYDNIFLMINEKRPYYFPRGVTEVYAEVFTRQEALPHLVVENNLVLAYPTAVFFFVNRANTELANLLTTGFLNAYQDGSYEEFL